MLNQNDYDRVNKCMIAPLSVLFNKKLSDRDELVEGFVEELARFSDDVLRKAFKSLRRTEKNFPSIAKAIEVCHAERPPSTQSAAPTTSSKETIHCRGHAERMHPNTARDILASPAGVLALDLGVARDLLNEYECTGRKEFDEDFVRQCKLGVERATEQLAALPRNTDIGKAMHALFEAMMAREKTLFSRFSSKIENIIAA